MNLSCPVSQLIWNMIETKLPVLLIVHNILTAAVFHHKSMYLGEQDKSQCVRWNHISTFFKKILWGLERWNVLRIKKKLLWLKKVTLQSSISVLLSRICCADCGKESLAPASKLWPARPNQATIYQCQSQGGIVQTQWQRSGKWKC